MSNLENNSLLNSVNKISEGQEQITRTEWENIKRNKDIILSQISNKNQKYRFLAHYEKIEKYFYNISKKAISLTKSDLLDLRIIFGTEKMGGVFEKFYNEKGFILDDYNKNLLEEIYNKFGKELAEKLHGECLTTLKIIYNNLENINLDDIEKLFDIINPSNSYLISSLSKIDGFNWNILKDLKESGELEELNKYRALISSLSRIDGFNWNIFKTGNLEKLKESLDLEELNKYRTLIFSLSRIDGFNWNILEKLKESLDLEELNKYRALIFSLSEIKGFNWNIFKNLKKYKLKELNKYGLLISSLPKINGFNWNILESFKKTGDLEKLKESLDLEELNKYRVLISSLSEIDGFNWNIFENLKEYKLKELNKYKYLISFLSRIDGFNWNIFENFKKPGNLEELNKYGLLISSLSRINGFNWNIFKNLDIGKLEFNIEISEIIITKEDLVFTIDYLQDKLTSEQILNYYNQNPKIFNIIFKGKKDEIIKSINRLHEPVDGMNAVETAQKRKEIAKNLSDIELFNLIGYGKKLFTSSFKDVLILELLGRLKKEKISLIRFSQRFEESQRVAFFSAIIERGTIQRFDLKNSEAIEIYDLIKNDIFKNKKNVIKFSLGLDYLFYLGYKELTELIVKDFLEKYDKSGENIQKTIIVIFKYFKNELKSINPNLLEKVKKYCKRFEINIKDYFKIDSEKWLKDTKLETKSVFFLDSDGKSSYHSFCRSLLRNGYRFDINKNIPLKLKSILKEINSRHDLAENKWKNDKKEANIRNKLVWSLITFINQNRDFELTLTKKINGVDIKHNLKVYEENNDNLIKDYIKSGSEGYIQRGHSYNRDELIDKQLSSLTKEEKEELKKNPNFIYLGSCGGMNDYVKVSDNFGQKSDIVATTGTGTMNINNPYIRLVFEYIAKNKGKEINWEDIGKDKQINKIFSRKHGEDYIIPGSLPHLLSKIYI